MAARRSRGAAVGTYLAPVGVRQPSASLTATTLKGLTGRRITSAAGTAALS